MLVSVCYNLNAVTYNGFTFSFCVLFIYFLAHLCKLHGGLICVTFRLSVCLWQKFKIGK